MSAKGIQEVLSRAMTDTAFARSLFEDAPRVLSGYDLTPQELERFKELPKPAPETPRKIMLTRERTRPTTFLTNT